MMKKRLALLLACLMLFTLTACGGESPAAPNGGTSQSSDSGQENIETPQGEEEESVPSFSVPTEGDPAPEHLGVDMTSIVPEGCTKVVNDDSLYLYMMPSEQTGETLVNYINETLMPALAALSDQGVCLTKSDIEERVQLYCPLDSYGYSNEDGVQMYWWIVDGEQFGTPTLMSADNLLVNVYYVLDGVLYNAITTVKADGQAICVTPFKEPFQNFRVVE